MSGRFEELLMQPGMGYGTIVNRNLGQGEALALAAMNPEAHQVVSRTQFQYSTDDFIRNLNSYIANVHRYLRNFHYMPWMQGEVSPDFYPEPLEVYEQKLRHHAKLVRDRRSLEQRYELVRTYLPEQARDDYIHYVIRTPVPMAPFAPVVLDEEHLPPPLPMVQRSQRDMWHRRHEGKKSKHNSRRNKSIRRHNKRRVQTSRHKKNKKRSYKRV